MYERHYVTRGILGFAIGLPVGTRQGNAQEKCEADQHIGCKEK
jgi:hypothetical protein